MTTTTDNILTFYDLFFLKYIQERVGESPTVLYSMTWGKINFFGIVVPAWSIQPPAKIIDKLQRLRLVKANEVLQTDAAYALPLWYEIGYNWHHWPWEIPVSSHNELLYKDMKERRIE